jgi:hypothetical protein
VTTLKSRVPMSQESIRKLIAPIQPIHILARSLRTAGECRLLSPEGKPVWSLLFAIRMVVSPAVV